MTQSELFDPVRADDRKTRGQKQVLDNSREEWKSDVLACILEIAHKEKEFIFDDVRYRTLTKGMSKPHHPNAWGAIMRAAATKGWIKKTNRCKPSTLVSNHGHMQTIWESNL